MFRDLVVRVKFLSSLTTGRPLISNPALYLKNSKQPNERHLASLYMSICTIHVLNCLCKKTATTMSMYINYCQKQKEHSLCFLFFFFFLFVVEMI